MEHNAENAKLSSAVKNKIWINKWLNMVFPYFFSTLCTFWLNPIVFQGLKLIQNSILSVPHGNPATYISFYCIYAYIWETPYEKPHSAINALYVLFGAFVMNCDDQEYIWLKFYKFPGFDNIMNCKGNGIVDGKLERPTIPCRGCFWPTTRERLPTVVLEHPSLFPFAQSEC